MSLWSNIKKFIGIQERQPEPPPEFPKEPPPRFPEPSTGGAPPIDRRGRDYWEERVIGRKDEMWGNSGRYNSERALRNLQNGVSPDFQRPSLSLLKWAANASDDELEVAIRAGGEYSFLFYK